MSSISLGEHRADSRQHPPRPKSTDQKVAKVRFKNLIEPLDNLFSVGPHAAFHKDDNRKIIAQKGPD